MSNQNGAVNVSKAVAAYFVGNYVADLRDVYLASLISGVNSVALGGAGLGKTDIVLSILNDIYNRGDYTFTRLSPASPAEVVEGAVDMAALMNNSEFKRNPAGTAMDGSKVAHVVDEIFRANAMVLQSLMFASDRKDMLFPPVLIGTANFLPKGDEFDALLSRFGLWHWVPNEVLKAGDVARAQLMGMGGGLHVPGTLPTAKDIEDVKAAALAPGADAVNAIAAVIDQLASDAVQAGYVLAPRQITFWSKLLLRAGAYYSGSNNFKDVPAAAMKFLRFAYRSASPDDQHAWSQIAVSVADPIAAVIDDVLAEAAKIVNDGVTKIDADKGAAMAVVGESSQKLFGLQGKLNAMGNDPRIKEANDTMMGWFGGMAAGRKVER